MDISICADKRTNHISTIQRIVYAHNYVSFCVLNSNFRKKDINFNKRYKSFKYRSQFINNGTKFNYANTRPKSTLVISII